MKRILILALLFIAACASNLPEPTVSEFVKTEGGGFLMERSKGVKYAMTYTLLPLSASATSYKVDFESTIPEGLPVSVEAEIETGTTQLLVQSPVISGAKNNRNYSVLLTLFEGNEVLMVQKDQVRFSAPPGILKTMGIAEY